MKDSQVTELSRPSPPVSGMLPRMLTFLVLFAVVMPREAWHAPHLTGTIATIIGAHLAQSALYFGWFDRPALWLCSGRARTRGLWVALFALVFVVVMGTSTVLEAVWKGVP